MQIDPNLYQEWIDPESHDVLIVRSCDDQDDCVVIQRWLTREPQAACPPANHSDPRSAGSHPVGHPVDEAHIRARHLPGVIAALQRAVLPPIQQEAPHAD